MSVIAQMREQLVKSGTIDLTKIGIGGAVPEAAARELLDLTVDDNEILKMVNVQRSDETKIPVDNFDIADFVLQNLPEGSEPTAFAAGENKGKHIECKPVNAFMQIYYSSIRSAKGAAAVKKFDAKLAKKFGANLVQVGFQGTSHSDTSTSVTSINKGWVKLLKDSTHSHKVDAGTYMTDSVISNWRNYLTAVVAAMPAKYKSADCVIFMNPSDYEKYVKEIGSLDGNSSLLINAGIKSFLGYPIKVARYVAENEIIFTNPKNLLLGLHNQIERQLENKPTARVVNYLYVVACGYNIGIDDAAVIAYDVTPGDNPAVPANAPAAVAFTDTDTDEGELGGTVTITKATSEADVTHYVLYFGSDSTTKTSEIVTLPKTGENLTYTFPSGQTFGANTHILAYTKNAQGLCATPAYVAITDVTA